MNTLWPPRTPPYIEYITAPPAIGPEQRKVVILGSTGSIGRNALAVAEESPQISILGLACGRNIQLLSRQAAKWRPTYLGVLTHELADELRESLPGDYHPQILIGQPGYAALSTLQEAQIILSAQAGSAGLKATIAAARAGKTIALANKESLVLAGQLLRKLCAESGSAILPVDSEHYALFQCLSGRSAPTFKKLLLTASGGPFRGYSSAQLQHVTLEQALRHPNWRMGHKITIDSATLMNKGLEFIEAIQLFGVAPEQVGVLIHPQSIVHSLVEFADNSMLGQFAAPDMALAIGACLNWPFASQPYVQPLDLTAIGPLTFEKPDVASFPCLGLAMQAAAYAVPEPWQALALNPACIILNAANEMAVELFQSGQCAFKAIGPLVASALQHLVYAEAIPFASLLKAPYQDETELIEILSGIARSWVATEAENTRLSSSNPQSDTSFSGIHEGDGGENSGNQGYPPRKEAVSTHSCSANSGALACPELAALLLRRDAFP